MKYWIGVVSREHVKIGEKGGFCQLNHGKSAPIKRLAPDDWLIYYSPKTKLHEGDALKAFTAIGKILNREPYVVEMSECFMPTRRDVDYAACSEASIHPLLDKLSFSKDNKSWGMIMRRGFFEITKEDFNTIASKMNNSLVQ
jgi:hypothetical protein